MTSVKGAHATGRDGAAPERAAPGSQTLARGLAALQLVAALAGRV